MVVENDFGFALNQLRDGQRVCRKGWNGKGMWVKYFHAGYVSDEAQSKSLSLSYAETPTMLSFLVLRTVDNAFIPWTPNMLDTLAQDWVVYNGS